MAAPASSWGRPCWSPAGPRPGPGGHALGVGEARPGTKGPGKIGAEIHGIHYRQLLGVHKLQLNHYPPVPRRLLGWAAPGWRFIINMEFKTFFSPPFPKGGQGGIIE